MGDELAKPLATDLSTSEFIELGWRRFRAGARHTLHCRLGGSPSSFGYLLPEGDDIRRVLREFEGIDAPAAAAARQPLRLGLRDGPARCSGRGLAQVSAAFSFFSSFGFDSRRRRESPSFAAAVAPLRAAAVVGRVEP